MMYLGMAVFTALLFFALTPGILLSLPPGGSKTTVAIVHALVFAAVYCVTQKMAMNYMYPDGFKDCKKY